MTRFEDLNIEDQSLLLKYPVYISILASTAKDGPDEKEIKTMLRLTHIKTFAGDPVVADFYRKAEIHFNDILTELENELPKDKIQRATAIAHELDRLQNILKKLSSEYTSALLQSMQRYKDQVSKAHHNVLEYFIFPVPIKGLSE